jgi:ABC-type sugar transport system substrate-binding protein
MIANPTSTLVIDFAGVPVETWLKAFALRAGIRPRLITCAASESAFAAVEAGDVYAVIAPDPFACGYQAVDRLVLLLGRSYLEQPAEGRGSILMPPRVVRKENVASYRASFQTLADAH